MQVARGRRCKAERKSAFGRLLLQVRTERGWTLQQFADATGRKFGSIVQWEYGYRTPSNSIASELARKVGVEPWVFEHAATHDRTLAWRRKHEVTSTIVGPLSGALFAWYESTCGDARAAADAMIAQLAMRKAG
jgi:transcriptional regulator with XRE-family HTH domain